MSIFQTNDIPLLDIDPKTRPNNGTVLSVDIPVDLIKPLITDRLNEDLSTYPNMLKGHSK